MDKKLLDSLNNLSLALTEISEALKSKSEASSGTAKALQGGDFIKEIKEINVGVKQLQKDTKQILANQQTIMKMGKQKKEETAAEKLGGDKKSQNNFKEGLKVILLIAVAVLAIGVAFKLIGSVNFLAVIALSIALPLLAIGFAKVHKVLKETGFNPKVDAKNFIIAVSSISLGIAMSSWILSMVTPISFAKLFTVTFLGLTFALLSNSIYKFIMAFKDMSWSQLIKATLAFPLILPSIALGMAFASWAFQYIKPISFTQFLTAVGIGLVFAIVSFGIRKMLKSFDGLNMKDLSQAVLFLPLILPAIALGIALSSYALQLVKPIGFVQFLTAVGIAIVFAVIAFGIRKMLKSFQGLDPATMAIAAISLPILLVAVSYAIAYSSIALGMIKPIKFSQFLTALGVAAVFVVLSFGIKQIVKGVSEMDWKSVPKIPVLFVLISLAITLSSYILIKAKIIPAANLLKLTLFGIALAVVVAAVGGVMALLNKMKVGFKDAIVGGLLIVIIAASIMISSHILALGNYKKYPDWKWALGVGLALIVFTPAVVLLGAIAMSGVGALAILAGAGMVLVVAIAITATSHILALGKYNKYPPLLWTLGVVAAMVPFAVMTVALGAIALTGIGLVAFLAGIPMITTVAETIVEVSQILSKGKYDNKGMLGWAIATTMLYAAFTPILLILGAVGIAAAVADFFGPNPWDMARTMMVQIAQTIVDVADVLSKGKFVGGPTKEWAEGVGIAIGAFSPVYKMLMANAVMSIFGGGGIGPKEFTEAILITSLGIVTAAQFFAANTAAFKNGPSKKWAEGVGTAIGAFAPVFKFLEDFPFSGGQKMAAAIKHVTQGIINAAGVFAKNKAIFNDGYPSKKWGEGVGAALGAFAPVFKQMHEDSGWFTSGEDVVNDMKYGISTVAWSLVDAASAFNTVGEAWKSYPSKDWALGVGNSVNGFMNLFQTIEERGYTLFSFKMYSNILTGALASIALSAKILWTNSKFFSVKLDPSFIKNISSNVLGYAALSKALTAILGTEEQKVVKKGFFGLTSTTTTVKKPASDVSVINRVLSQLIDSARIIYGSRVILTGATDVLKKMSAGQMLSPDGKSVDSGTNFMGMLSKNVMGYAALIKKLESLLTNEEKVSITKSGFFSTSTTTTTQKKLSDVSIVNRVVSQMVSTAGILYFNRKFFEAKIDENYMDKVSKNVITFANLALRLREIQKDESIIDEAFGLDPISRAARGMVKIAGAYDVLAKSIKNFSSAINSLNVVKLSLFRSLTGNLAVMSAMDSTMFSNMLKTLEQRSGVFAQLLKVEAANNMSARPTVKAGGGQAGVSSKKDQGGGPHKDAKGETALMKLDKMVMLLTKINQEVGSLDEFINAATVYISKKDKDIKIGKNAEE